MFTFLDWLGLFAVLATLILTPKVLQSMRNMEFRQGLYRKQGGAQGREFGYYWR